MSQATEHGLWRWVVRMVLLGVGLGLVLFSIYLGVAMLRAG